MRILKFNIFEGKRRKDLYLDELDDRGSYYMRGNVYVPKYQETEYTHFTEDIKNVFNDIVDLGSAYSVSYNERWYLTEVIITLDKSLFNREKRDYKGYYYTSVRSDSIYKKDFEIVDKFCEDEIEYRLERIKDLFGTSPSMAGEHLLINKDGKNIVHKYPGCKNVYIVTKDELEDFEDWSYEICIFFGSVEKKLPYGEKAKPQRKIDNDGKYVD